MYGLVHRKDIYTSMRKVYEDSILTTISGQVDVEAGNYIGTNVDGDQLIFSEDYVNEMKQIKAVTNPTHKKAPEGFASEYMKQLQMMEQLQQDESELWGK